MVRAVFRQIVVILSLLTFVGAGFAEAMTMDAPAPSGMAMQSSSEAPMPCCPEKAASCVIDVGCVFLVGLPMPQPIVSKTLAWSSLTYQISHDRGEGLSIQPALGPPILPA